MTGATSEDDLLLKIQCLVSDSLGVVSYKWLSRNFSISSNVAKRVLQQFAERNVNLDVVVVYAISGWTKKDPQTYAIQLVPKSKLEEAKSALKGTPSIHIYSVQRCLPKDPAQLWSADFAQAEQLFNESADDDNCLRDNRFSAVTCSLVQRSSAKKDSAVSVAQIVPPASNAPSLVPQSAIPVQRHAEPARNSGMDMKDTSVGKKSAPSSVLPKTSQNDHVKDSVGPVTTVKRKSPASTGGSGGGGALASMWGKAPTKPQASAKLNAVTTPILSAICTSPPLAPTIAGDAEARILAMEADDGSEDDIATDAALRSVSSAGGRRRRRMINDSDDEADEPEPIIRLGTPDSPQERKHAVTASGDALASERNASSVNETRNPGVVANLDSKPLEMGAAKSSSLEPNLNSTSEKEGGEAGEVKPVTEVARGGSKRTKVLKTRIDERGREVSEVIWESEGPEKENLRKDLAAGTKPEKENVGKDLAAGAKPPASSVIQRDAKPPTERPQVGPKPSAVPSKSATGKASSKPSAKSMGKPGKGQGNIMSFFKKT